MRERFALTGDDRDIFALEVSAVVMGSKEDKAAFIDEIMQKGEWKKVAYIMGDPNYLKDFGSEVEPRLEKAIKDGRLIKGAFEENLRAEQRHQKYLNGMREEERNYIREYSYVVNLRANQVENEALGKVRDERKVEAAGSKVRQAFVDDLVKRGQWSQIAFLLVDPKGAFNKEVANVAILLPSEFEKYMENEARFFATREYDRELVKLNEENEETTKVLEAVLDKQDAEIKPIELARDAKIAELKAGSNIEKEQAETEGLRKNGLKQVEEERQAKITALGIESPKTRGTREKIEGFQERRKKSLEKKSKRIVEGGVESIEAFEEQISRVDNLKARINTIEAELKEDKERSEQLVDTEDWMARAEKEVRSAFGAEVKSEERLFKKKLGNKAKEAKEKELAAAKKEVKKIEGGWEKAGLNDVVKRVRKYDRIISKNKKELGALEVSDAEERKAKVAKIEEETTEKKETIEAKFSEGKQKLEIRQKEVQDQIEIIKTDAQRRINKITTRYKKEVEAKGAEQAEAMQEKDKFENKKEEYIKESIASRVDFNKGPITKKIQSLQYLMNNGRIDAVVECMYLGEGKKDHALRQEFLKGIGKDPKRLDEVIAAVAGFQPGELSQPAVLAQFIEDLMANNLVNKDRLDRLEVNKDDQNKIATKLIEENKFEAAYDILKANEKLEIFQLLMQPKVTSYETLKFYYSAFDDKRVGSRSAGELLAKSTNFDNILAGIEKAAESASINEKVNLAGILSDAYRALEDPSVDLGTRQQRQEKLEGVYKEKLAVQGQKYGLASILDTYDKDRLYAQIKRAVASQKEVAGVKTNVDKDRAAEMLLFAPNLQVVGKTKDIVERIGASTQFDKGGTFADWLRECFNDMLSALSIIPKPHEIMDVAAYMVGLKRTLPQGMEKDIVQEAKALKDELEIGKRARSDVAARG
jgi:hypothetical protein